MGRLGGALSGAARLRFAELALRGVFVGLCSILLAAPPIAAGADRVPAAGGAATSDPAESGWVPPVDAPIADPFRPLDPAMAPATEASSMASREGSRWSRWPGGRVTFVGAIAGGRFVVVTHPDGLRSTYAFVAEILVVKGKTVAQGELLARAAVGFHLTARIGDEYVDPAALFAGAIARPRLIADASAGRAVADREASVKLGPLDPLRALLQTSNDLTLTSQLMALARAAGTWRDQDC
ncbi:MAG: M23 family metallopeptidase [Actinomycetota bacterium]|nr:M23 family metallopeptidase [Actinomycetota bacterium]